MKQANNRVEIDLFRIFLTPPNTLKEKVILFILLFMTFVIFFAPICFSPIHPMKAILLACMPSLSLSWGWIVLMRSLFRKQDFCK